MSIVILHANDGNLNDPADDADGGLLPVRSRQESISAELSISAVNESVINNVGLIPLVWCYAPAVSAYRLDDNLKVTIPAHWFRATWLPSAIDGASMRIPYQQRLIVPSNVTRVAVTLVDATGTRSDPPTPLNVALILIA